MNKKRRREDKKKIRRGSMEEEVIYIFEKILDKWKTICIYNTIIQNNKFSKVLKRNVENISTGNSKVYEYELSTDRYNYYLELRSKVYNFHKIIILYQRFYVRVNNYFMKIIFIFLF